jgi:hypothetical protein
MICSNCSIENKKTSRFCGQCGQKLNSPLIDINNLKNKYQQVKALYITFLKFLTLLLKDKPKLLKISSAVFLVSLTIYEGEAILNPSKVSSLESILGYQYDFKSGEKLFLTKRNGQYYYSTKQKGESQ